jgi:hypothetical protein
MTGGASGYIEESSEEIVRKDPSKKVNEASLSFISYDT